jgi:hypothetical protein
MNTTSRPAGDGRGEIGIVAGTPLGTRDTVDLPATVRG